MAVKSFRAAIIPSALVAFILLGAWMKFPTLSHLTSQSKIIELGKQSTFSAVATWFTWLIKLETHHTANKFVLDMIPQTHQIVTWMSLFEDLQDSKPSTQ
jgi:hypothetical protein